MMMSYQSYCQDCVDCRCCAVGGFGRANQGLSFSMDSLPNLKWADRNFPCVFVTTNMALIVLEYSCRVWKRHFTCYLKQMFGKYFFLKCRDSTPETLLAASKKKKKTASPWSREKTCTAKETTTEVGEEVHQRRPEDLRYHFGIDGARRPALRSR